jgi:hypothetical protein
MLRDRLQANLGRLQSSELALLIHELVLLIHQLVLLIHYCLPLLPVPHTVDVYVPETSLPFVLLQVTMW